MDLLVLLQRQAHSLHQHRALGQVLRTSLVYTGLTESISHKCTPDSCWSKLIQAVGKKGNNLIRLYIPFCVCFSGNLQNRGLMNPPPDKNHDLQIWEQLTHAGQL